jgi:hypothetical protein
MPAKELIKAFVSGAPNIAVSTASKGPFSAEEQLR